MKPQNQRIWLRLVASLSVAAGLSAGCFKAGAQKDAESLAEQLRNEPGCTAKLRQWFSTVQSTPRSEKSITLPLPDCLASRWWRGAKALGVWSDDGALQRITVTHDICEPGCIIGPPTATAESLGLTQHAGEPPTFYAQVTNGIYTLTPYYK